MMTRPHNSNPEDAYRPCVGIALFNREGLVLIAERIERAGNWQMPQGGIDEGETLEVAAFREMEEEIGTRNAEILNITDGWIKYEVPAELRTRWNPKHIGQKQKWVALRFLGNDSEIRLDAHTPREFSQWKWAPLHTLPSYAPTFKRHVYDTVAEVFKPFAVKESA